MGYEELRDLLPKSDIAFNEPMSRHTSFRIGGPADVFVVPGSLDELKTLLKWCHQRSVRLLAVGRGTNLLVRDGGFRGVIVQIGASFQDFEIIGSDGVRADAGWILSELCVRCASLGLSGLEFACGIPGSLGGAIYMNAGAYGGQMSDVVTGVVVLNRQGEEEYWGAEKLDFSYRHSALQDRDYIAIAADLRLRKASPEIIFRQIQELTKARKEKQPLNEPSAGSIFKRPPGHFAGKLIEQAGFKGRRVGDAQVSTKHAGFIVNLGHATASDVIKLIGEIQRGVYEKTGVLLEPEIKVIGEEHKEG